MRYEARTSRVRKRLVTVVASVGLLALVAACGGGGDSSGSADGKGSYKVGVLLGLTGSYSTLGEPELAAAKAYVDRVNKAGGIKGHQLELVTVDSRSEESAAVNGFRKLATQDKVIAILGPSSSGESIAVRQLADSLKVPTITMASASAITTGSAYTFKTFYAPTFSIKAMLFAAAEAGKKKVAVITPNSEYGNEAIKATQDFAGAYGLEYVGVERYDPAATDMTPQLTKLRAKKAEAVIAFSVLPQSSIIAKNAKQIGLDALLIQGPGGASEAYLTGAGDSAEGTLVQGSKSLVPDTVPEADPQKKTLVAFDTAYRAATGKPGNQFAGNSWDAFTLLQTALEKGDVDPSNLTKARQALLDSLNTNIQDVPGLNARYTFTKDDHASESMKGLSVLKVEGGKYVLFNGDIPDKG
jgi:branched-chain amino acid transport system substrate-binding protein